MTLNAIIANFQTFKLVDLLDIIIISFLIYQLLGIVNRTRAGQLFKGALLVMAVYLVAETLNMRTVTWLLNSLLQVGLLTLVVLFQPEIRRALERMGQTDQWAAKLFNVKGRYNDPSLKGAWRSAIIAICDAAERFSETKTGALIVFERSATLDEQMRSRAGEDAVGAPPPARPSPRQQAREARQAAEEKAMSQTVRDVYRKLASALHPDREPDPAERQRKTALMQRVNEAYQANNLLRLLELQIEIEQIDSAHLAGLAPERLKRYTQILRTQLQDLEVEINGIEYDLRQQLNLRGRITPKALLQHVDADVAALDGEIRRLDGELALSADLKALKAWLKSIRPARRQEAWGGFPF